MANTRKHSINTSSRYKGISFDKQRNRWCMNVTLNGKIVAHRKFLHEREAAIAYDIKSKEFFGEFSCVNISDASKEEIEKINEILKNPKKNYNCSSKYLGVHKNKKNRWLAQFKIIKDGKRYSIHIGSFKEELDAAKAYNIYKEKNNDFKKRPSNDIEISHLDRERIESYIFGNKIIENPLSKYLNVTKMRNKWQTSISINKKRVHIGTYNTEKEAAIAYNKKAIELFGDEAKLNIIEN